MSRLSKRTINLTAEKQALLEALLREEGVESSTPQKIPRRKDLGPVPLSFAQQRLWFLDQLAPANSAYNIADAIHLSGYLDVICLQSCLSEIIKRHESLRTCFITVDGSPLQLINPPQPLSLPVVDLSALEASDRKQQALRLASEEGGRGFDLQRGPLIRARLLRLQPDSHIVLLTMHHIISDGWSMEVLVREVTTLYDMRRQGSDERLEELPIQYADYAVWQREYMRGERLEEQLKYWREQLAGAAAMLELPTDRPRPAIKSYEGASLTVELEEGLSRGLRELSRREGLTMFMTMLAAYKVLMYRMSGQEDIVVGTPVAGRTRVELEPLIGFFVNTLAMRSRVSGGMSFKEVMREEKEVVLGAMGHQEVPFERVVEEMEPERSVSYSPIFQVMFDMESRSERGESTDKERLRGLEVEGVESEWRRSKFDLTLSLSETHRGMEMTWEYSTDLFDGATIERMTECYKLLLEGIVADPCQKISEIVIVSEGERRRQIEEWNETGREYADHSGIHQLFEQQAQATPDSIAVASEDGMLTYAELNSRANQLAHYLRRQGVGPEAPVGICMRRSPEMIVALLGVLKAGGAYVPLDPDYPQQRLAFMIEDTRLKVVVIGEPGAAGILEHEPSLKIVRMDSDSQAISRLSRRNLPCDVAGDNLAYVMYTSGSTGLPKGVSIIHRGVVRLVKGADYADLGSDQVYLQYAPFTFDASTLEIWGCLLNGGRLVVMPPGKLSLEELGQVLEEQAVNTVWLTAGLFAQMVETNLSGLRGIKQLLAGGDVLSVQHVLKVLNQLKGCTLINGYGPTENTTFTCCYKMTSPDQVGDTVSIGRPISNTKVYLLDEHLNPMPVGLTGRLFIAGHGLARGYLNRPELTAEQFIPTPFSDNLGARMYRAGDLARYLPDGNIEFLGRLDHQVKVRGFRIEPAEIEAALRQLELVREAVVIARKDPAGDTRLIAYLVANGSCSVAELRQSLRQNLPEYMIPQAFVMLEQMPLTPAGKVDRRALSALKLNRPETEKGYIAPRTEVEELLAQMWRQILGVEEVGVHDNFFELGGDSIRAAIFINRLQDRLDEVVQVIALFNKPNIAELAMYLTQQYPQAVARVCGIEPADEDKASDRKELIQIKRMPRDADAKFPLSFAQQRLWFLDQLAPANSAYNIADAIHLTGHLDVVCLQRCLSEIVARHESLRTSFITVDGSPLQLINPPRPLSLPVVDLSALEASDRKQQALQLANDEGQRGFDLQRGPLIRARLLRLQPDSHIVLLTMHHIISDGWSMEVLVREVTTLYDRRTSGDYSRLEELPIQYADYAVWQREYLQGERLEEQLKYWREQLAGAPPLLELATDRPRPAIKSYEGASVTVELEEGLSRGLRELSRREGLTMFMTMLAAYKVLMYRMSGQEDIVVGTPVAGRTRVELEPLIGFFVNTLAMRSRLRGEMSFKEVMREEKEVVLGAMGHQEVPFERVVEEMEPERSVSYSPIFQVMFDMESRSEKWNVEEVRLGELEVEGMESEWKTSKFDMTLSLSDTPQGLVGFWAYSTDLFDAETISRMTECYKLLLEGIVADPSQKICDLPILSEAERRRLIEEWNETRRGYAEDSCIHQLFEQQAERTPEAVAVVFEGERLSYKELNSRANELGRYLQGLGVGPEALVGVYVPRSIEMIVGLLGILKAGGAYVPIDPAYPPERISFMLSEIKAPVILTLQRFEHALPSSGSRVVYLDTDREVIASHDGENFAGGATADNLAYAIFTSGSTGQPKGVMVEHRSLCNLAEAQIRAFGVQPYSRVLQFAPFSFDASVSEVFTTLIKGATLCLAEQKRLMPGPELIELLSEWEIDIVTLPPTVLAALPEDKLLLSTVVAAGEACSADVARRWAVGRKFLNAYGPTEATVCATIAEIIDADRKPDIGRPISNVEVYVLDQQRQPVPIGVVGELCIGGAGVARGYLNRAELTAERFIPDPFGGRAGARLYKTGDLVRYLPDGNIEYIGRADNQVKVRGYRIELGEIEEALRQHDAVREAVALMIEDAPGEKRLAAYLIPNREAALTVSELRSFLSGKLPEYMIPQAFVMLEEMPLTPAGKVDRRALSSLKLNRPEMEKGYIAPRTELEELLAQMWKQILGVDEVGVHDNFFELGGDSIRGAIFINRLQEKLGEVVYVVALFDAPNVAELAMYLTKQYPQAVARVCGTELAPAAKTSTGRVDATAIGEVRALIRSYGSVEESEPDMGAKNPPAIFILSPPRSGSTLLRVMLGGHPSLFAPPELELLGFRTLDERAGELTGRYSFWLEGTIRAIMQINECDAEEARTVMRQCEDEGMTTKQFYGRMQKRLAGRRLVDKTPSYSLDERVLKRAEEYFENALYIHLLRHPSGMIRSFTEAKLEQVFFRYRHGYTSKEIAEIIWQISQENILSFLEQVPQERQLRVRFEELVRAPERVINEISEFLGITPCEDMLKPYAEKELRMTNGIHPLSKMLGDIKFHEHKGIDADAAERWKEGDGENELADVTCETAERLGYESESRKRAERSFGGTRFVGKELTQIRRAPRGKDAKYPLSFAQQRLWFLNQLEPNSHFYNIPLVIRLIGNLRVEELEKSFNEIIRRHEVLRTTFTIVDAQPVQVIAPELKLTLSITDLSRMPSEYQEAEVERLAGGQSREPFDLEKGPLLRASLARLNENDHVIMITMHHIVSDEWSMEALVREVAALYDSFSQGKPSSLPDLPIQYADFALWQREYLQGGLLDEHLSYWKRQLAGAPPVLELPTDRPRPSAQSYRGAGLSIELGEKLSRELKRLSQQENMTLFMTLLAAYRVLLYRMSGERDIVVGTPIAGRTRVELEELIGFFVNTLAIRVKLEGEMSFKEVMRKEREAVVGGYGHQEVPFERVVEEMQPERSLSYSPIFQVAFNFLNATSKPEISLPELSLMSMGGNIETSKFDLVMVVMEAEHNLFVDLRYSTDLFNESTIKRMLTYFQRLIEAAVADPQLSIQTLPMLTEADVRRLIVERNNTSSPYPTRDFVHHLFEHQASRRPDAAALVSEDRLLTYDELNRRANQTANYLRSLGVGPETPVGVCMKGSIEMVVATLGILKAGGAYIPLDPAYPTTRLSLMIEESMMPVLLTQQNLEERLPVHWGQVTLIDSDWEVIEQHSRENPDGNINPENLAYVIYTSGSTGKPKGVQISHESLLNMIYWYQQNFAVTPADRATQVAGVAFDASVWEIWPCLTAGASIHFPNEEIRTSPLQLRDWLVSKDITISFLPTPLAESILSLDWPKDVALRTLQTAGDKLHRHPSKPLPFSLVNNYGPTENTVVATSGGVPVRPQEAAAPHIGRPVHNTQLYLLDSDLQLVPDGARGELHIGGSSLARGYLFQPDVTAERFIPDPFGGRAGARLYKTGDLVRYLSDGNIEFLGRVDDQVKVRGFRIELGDIEAALSRHPSLLDSIVIAREDAPGEIRLAAYLVCKPDQAPSTTAMRAYLKELLPEYMIPQAFVTLDALPLTPNGKVDRKALPAPYQSRPHLDRDFVAPRNELERFLADKWREVLGVEEIGIYDNFFEVGGESLKVAVLINTLQQELGEVLQVVSIFDAPNIAAFADYLKKDCPAAVSSLLGNEPRQEEAPAVIEKIDSDKVALLRRLITPLPPREQRDRAAATKNRPAIFVLSSPRSGSTLLRVMMGGHPRLFAPPELELLSFNTLEERRAAFSGRDSFWLEGAIRAVMEIKGCDAEEAKNVIELCEEQKLTTKQFYRLMQEWLADRMLVDKSPAYAMDLEILNRAETDFEDALFIHLIRSPQGMIRSYEEAKLDRIFPRFKHPFSAREVAELVWVISCRNILKFLSRVPQERQHRVKFEELVNEPESVTRGMCRFLGIEFDSRMLQPYKDQEKKMTNGIYTVSRMLGDVKFHQHTEIDSAAAESWREYYPEDFLGDITFELAESLGYKEEKTETRLYIDELFERPSPSSPLVAIQPYGSNRPFFCAHPGGGNVLCYVDLSRRLGEDQPFYAFQARGLNGEQPVCTSIEEMAALYLEAMRTVQPEGPYLLGGWSMGGVIAFEIARQLEAQGEQIDLLVLMDARAPNYNEDFAEEDELTAMASFSRHLGLEPERINISFEHFLSLGLDERLAYFMEEAKSAGLMPLGITLSQIQNLFEVFKANGTAMSNYVPGMVGCRIVLLTAGDRLADVPQRMVTGWNELTENDVEILEVPGNHFTMIREPYIRFTAERLKSRIHETVAG